MTNPLKWVYDGQRVDWPRVVLLSLVAAVILGIGFFGTTTGAGFGPFNPTWDGTSDFRGAVAEDSNTEVVVATETEKYDELVPGETVAFVLAPDDTYGDEDAERVREFVEAGGTLVMMDNFDSFGNELLADVGANASVDGQLVRDEHHNDDAPTMPLARTVANHTLTDGVEQLTLNYASVIEPESATVLINTSEFAYLTDDEDAELDDDTELISAPVATTEEVGAGTVIAVSDPSIAINIMYDRSDNAAFLHQLSAQGETVLLDLSHTDDLPPLTGIVFALRDSWLLQVFLGGAGITALALAGERRLRTVVTRLLGGGKQTRVGAMVTGILNRVSPVQPTGFPWLGQHDDERPLTALSEEELAAYLRKQHPDWDGDRIKRLIKAFKEGDGKPEGEQKR